MAYTSRAIARFGGNTNVSSSAGTTTTFNLPASIPAFAVIILIATYNGPVSVGDPTGYTLIRKSQQQTSPTFKASNVVWMKYATGSEASTITATTTTSLDWTATCQVYTGGTESDGSPALLEFLVAEGATAEDNAAADTTVTTSSPAYTSSDYGLWRLSFFNEVSVAGNTWTASGQTERSDITSSGAATKSSAAFYDSNAAITSGTNGSVVGTSSNSSGGARVTWCGLLRLGKGGAVSDVVGNNDATIAKTVTLVRSDTEPLTDATVSKTRTLFKSDNEPLSDTSTKTKTVTITTSDTQALTDSNVKSRTMVFSDADALTDQSAKTRSLFKSDTESATDTSLAVKTATVTQSDTQALTDSNIKSRTLVASDADSLTDATSKTQSLFKSDTEPLTDTGVGSKTATVTSSDTSALSDATFKAVTKTVTDAPGLADSDTIDLHPANVPVVITDLETLTDTSVRSLTKTSTDALGITDGISLYRELHPTPDTLTLTDVNAKSLSRVVSDNPGLSDNTSRSLQKLISDSLGMTDTSAMNRLLQHITTDAQALTDSNTEGKGSAVNASDLSGSSDLAFFGRGKDVTDSVAIADSFGRSATTSRASSDLSTLTDFSQFRQSLVRSSTEALIDSFGMARAQTVTDPEGLEDFDFVGPYSRLHIAGGGGTSRTFLLVISDGIGMFELEGETVDPGEAHAITRSDSTGLRDSSRNNQKRVNANDRFRLRDGVAVTLIKAEQVTSDRMRLRDKFSVELTTVSPWRSIGETTR